MRSWKRILTGLTATVALAVVMPAYADGPAAGGAAVAAPVNAAPSATGDERAQVRAVYQQLRSDVQQMRADAKTQIRALLNDQQQAQLDAMKGFAGVGGGRGPMAGKGCAGGPKFGQGHKGKGPVEMGLGNDGAPGGGFEHQILHRLTEKLNLTDAEQASVQTVLDNTRSAMKARADQARADFRAILTPDQVAKLDELKAQDGPGKPGGRRGFHKGDAASGGPLQLTADQKSQKEAIFTQMRTDMQALHADARTQIRALLTPDQQTQFDTMKPGPGADGNGPWAGKLHGFAARRHEMRGEGNPTALLGRLTTRLNLTDAQQASVKGILTTLHTNVQARVQQARTDAQAIRQEAGATSGGTTP